MVAIRSGDAWSPAFNWFTGTPASSSASGDIGVSLANGVVQRRHAALRLHLLVEHVLTLDPGGQHTRRTRSRLDALLLDEVAAFIIHTVLAQRREVDHPRRLVHIGATRDQQLDDIEAIGGGGKDERRLADHRLGGIDVGASGKKGRHRRRCHRSRRQTSAASRRCWSWRWHQRRP